ncbi:hypothetical protein ACHAXR_009158 [Thalassiosira sp. AJA248-18]
MDALHHHHRAAQADNNVVTIITGTGVDEAELPNNNQNQNQEDQEEQSTTSIEPNYTQDQCTTWITSILSSDTDSSNGLSESEFHTFLTSIEEPPYVAAYFDQYADSYQDLPWIFQVIHKTLACRCQDLGLGEYCCEGDDSEVPFIGLRDGGGDDNDGAAAAVVLTPEQQNVAVEYRADICNSIAVVFTRFIPTPGPTAAPTTPSPTVSELFAGMATTPSPTPWPPESGVVFECVDEVLCNAFDPSLDTIPSSSGWNSIGYCGPDTDIESCPQAHNDNDEYIEGDRVTIVSLPTTGVVFECANEGSCNENDPSLDTSSGWMSIGDCGTAAAEDAEDEEIVICPPRHDEDVTYDEGDQVTIARENVGAAPMIINIVGSVVDYSALGIKNYAIFDSSSIDETEYYNADQVMSNDGDNKVLRQVISGFGQLAIELLGELNAGYTEEGKRNLRRAGTTATSSSSRALQGTMGSMDPVHVEDIGE